MYICSPKDTCKDAHSNSIVTAPKRKLPCSLAGGWINKLDTFTYYRTLYKSQNEHLCTTVWKNPTSIRLSERNRLQKSTPWIILLCKGQNQAKLIYGVRSLDNSCPWDHKGFRGTGYVLFLDLIASCIGILCEINRTINVWLVNFRNFFLTLSEVITPKVLKS